MIVMKLITLASRLARLTPISAGSGGFCMLIMTSQPNKKHADTLPVLALFARCDRIHIVTMDLSPVLYHCKRSLGWVVCQLVDVTCVGPMDPR